MTEKSKMLSGKYYLPFDEELSELRLRARELTWRFNQIPPGRWEEGRLILEKLLGKCPERFFLEAPFHCDYGFNISLGENFYANFGCVMLDCAAINIGDNVLFGPGVSLFAVGHPVHPRVRNTWAEQARPVRIGDNVWLGGNVIVNPGANIGHDCVIGSGSVVTGEIPPGVVAAGNPCRVLRQVSDADLQKGMAELEAAHLGHLL